MDAGECDMWITDALGEEHELSPGDEVLLNWYGDANVPKGLHYKWARVKDINSHGNLVVDTDLEYKSERTIVAKRHVLDVRSA